MEELEARFEISDVMPVFDRLKEHGAKLLWLGLEKNIFLDTSDQKLKQSGLRLRLRERRGCAVELCLKGPKKCLEKGYKKEREVSIRLANTDMEEALPLLTLLGFSEMRRYEKLRAHWEYADAYVEVDRVGHRFFVEIEAPSKQDINYIAEMLGIDRSRAVTESYYDIYKAAQKT